VVTTEHRGVRQPHSFVKINVDAVFHQSTGSGVWGAIDSIALRIFTLHTWQWTLCKGSIKYFSNRRTARCRKTDCINLQRPLMTSTSDFAPIGVSIGHLKFILQMSFIEASVAYTP
jgi:hypothetical protein